MSRLIAKRVPEVGVLVVFVAVVVSACGGCQGEQQAKKARPLPKPYPSLRPGTYSSEEFEPALSFSVGEGWTIGWEYSDSIWIMQGDPAKSSYLSSLLIINVRSVYESDTKGTTRVVPVPEDLAAWYHRHPYLQAAQPQPITVGGANGVQFEIVAEDLPENYYAECGVGCVDLFPVSSNSFFYLGERLKGRVIILNDVKGDTVVIQFDSPPAEYYGVLPEAQKVIDSVKWEEA